MARRRAAGAPDRAHELTDADACTDHDRRIDHVHVRHVVANPIVAEYPECVDPQPAASTSATGTTYGVDVGVVVVVVEVGEAVDARSAANCVVEGASSVVSTISGVDDTISSMVDSSLEQAPTHSSDAARTMPEVRLIIEFPPSAVTRSP
jgi:hypothetical protein